MIRILIVDDEEHAREMLITALSICYVETEVIGTAATVEEAAEKVNSLKPDLILLDINLPDGTGFDVLDKLIDKKTLIVFVTAYDHYAVKAFKFSAVDYIVKPVDIDELESAIEKAKEQKETNDLGHNLQVLIDNMNNSSSEEKKIVLKTQESIHIVKVSEVIHCISDQNYTEFYLVNKRRFVVSRTIKEFEELLSDYGFFRPHQSHIINVNRISHFDKTDGGALVMEDGTNVPVSKRKRSELFELFENL